VYQNIKPNAGKEFGSFSFVQLWAAMNCNRIPAECIAEFLGNQPTKHKRHLEITG
jgi:hypothetical protein